FPALLGQGSDLGEGREPFGDLQPARVQQRPPRLTGPPSRPRRTQTTHAARTTHAAQTTYARPSDQVVHELPELGQVAALVHRNELGIHRRGRVASTPVAPVLRVEPVRPS